MMGTLEEFLTRDHQRLDALLEEMRSGTEPISLDRWDEFRAGLLRHIGIEERILFRALRQSRGRTSLDHQLHLDHAVLAALLVPPPTRAGIDLIREILAGHNPLEESPAGLYAIVESLAAEDLPSMMERIALFPAIPVAPFSDTPLLRETIAQLLREREEYRP